MVQVKKGAKGSKGKKGKGKYATDGPWLDAEFELDMHLAIAASKASAGLSTVAPVVNPVPK